MGVRQAFVDFPDALDGERFAGGLARELAPGAVDVPDGDGEGVILRGLDEVGGLIRVRELFLIS